jgi:cell division transport system permease protein
LLGFTLVAVTFNTIRLQVLTHREEIEVSRLVGATDAFIRRPFFYLGSLLGVFGAGIGLAIVGGALAVINGYLAPLGRIYGVDPNLSFFSQSDLLAIVVFAGMLGWVGAYLSVSVHLRHIGPTEHRRSN